MSTPIAFVNVVCGNGLDIYSPVYSKEELESTFNKILESDFYQPKSSDYLMITRPTNDPNQPYFSEFRTVESAMSANRIAARVNVIVAIDDEKTVKDVNTMIDSSRLNNLGIQQASSTPASGLILP